MRETNTPHSLSMENWCREEAETSLDTSTYCRYPNVYCYPSASVLLFFLKCCRLNLHFTFDCWKKSLRCEYRIDIEKLYKLICPAALSSSEWSCWADGHRCCDVTPAQNTPFVALSDIVYVFFKRETGSLCPRPECSGMIMVTVANSWPGAILLPQPHG